MTLDTSWYGRLWLNFLQTVTLPLSLILYIICFLAQPRRAGRRSIWFLTIHFLSFSWVNELPFVVYPMGQENTDLALIHLGRALLQTWAFYYAVRFRASIGRLQDKDLNNFLLHTIFKRGIMTLIPVFFVTNRFIKCALSNGYGFSIDPVCSGHSTCSLYASLFLIIIWLRSISHASVKRDLRKYLKASAGKVAKINLPMREVARGFSLLVMMGNGGFL